MRPLQRFKLIFFFFILPVFAGIAAGGYIALARGVPSVEELKDYKAQPGTKVYADDETLIGEIKLEKGIFVALDKIPPSLINAALAVEDSHFWSHSGIDYLAIMRAALKDILYRELKEGGSTITQQLAKITFLTPEKTFTRKLREMVLARKLEKSLKKDEILELYLNRAYFGHGAYGVEMAARTYFGKSVTGLTIPEAAMLAGLLKAPATYSPYTDLRKAKERQAHVLERMEEEGYITRTEKDDALQSPISLRSTSRETASYNYFITEIRKYLEGKYSPDAIYKEGLRVFTTLDGKDQLYAQQALDEGLRALDKRRGFRGPIDHRLLKDERPAPAESTVTLNTGEILEGLVLSVSKKEAVIRIRDVAGRLNVYDASWASVVYDGKKTSAIKDFNLTKVLKPGDVVLVRVKSVKGATVQLELEQEPDVQGALVAIDHSTGYIRALVGGRDYLKSEYNRAVYAKRQVGSAFKPVVYATALDNGFHPSSIAPDEAVTFKWKEAGREDEWSPRNFDGEYFGSLTLREALAYSRNAVTARLINTVGVGKVIGLARDLGIESPMPYDLTLSLGSLSVSPLELTTCYAGMANGGKRMKPIMVKYITDSKGRVIESAEPEGTEALSPQTAFLITSMMRDVVNYGTGQRAKALGRPVAGKTGTTNEFWDAWFLGFTPELTTGVWVGFDDLRPLGDGETGSRAALPIWVRFMQNALAGVEQRDFVIPEGIVVRNVDPETGEPVEEPVEGSLPEYFKRDAGYSNAVSPEQSAVGQEVP